MAEEELKNAEKTDGKKEKPVPPPNPAKEKMKKTVYTIFSDKIMIVLAVIAIPAIVAEFYFQPTSIYYLIAYVVDWFIWLAFVLEFAFKLYVENEKGQYLKSHKFDSIISVLIIVSPVIGLFANKLAALPILRIARITRLLKASTITQGVKLTRTAAYASNATVKEVQPKPRQDSFVISRTELRQVLTVLGIKEREINNLTTALDKAHRHTNIIIFANLLEKLGIDRDKMGNVFRRMGMDDVTISSVFRMVDENKISAETGRLYDASIDFEVQ